VTRPDWGGWRLCLQWGSLTDEGGRPNETGYRNIWRDENGRLFTGRAQTRIPSKAISDELWNIAANEGWANMLGDGADQWQRVIIRHNSDDVVNRLSAEGLINKVSGALFAAGYPSDAEVFRGQNSANDYIFFLSPKAFEIAVTALGGFPSTPCQRPDLGDLRKVIPT